MGIMAKTNSNRDDLTVEVIFFGEHANGIEQGEGGKVIVNEEATANNPEELIRSKL